MSEALFLSQLLLAGVAADG